MNNISSPLFQNLDETEIKQMKAFSRMRKSSYMKGDLIFRTGDIVCEIGIVQKGSVNIENTDLWGNRSILSNLSEGQVFAETYALCHEPMMVDAVAADFCEILFLNFNMLMEKQNIGQSWYSKILNNMLQVSVQKNLLLSNRIFCTTAKTIRGRLLTLSLIHISREWACKKNTDGFVNIYDFDTEGLKVLNLLDGNHTVLNWIALLLQFRTFKLDSEVAIDARDYIIEHYSVDLTGYDIVIGYRADDSYFQYAESFVSNTLPLRSLNKALRLGKLGEQTVVISSKGFERLKFTDAYPVDKSVYYPKFLDRDTKARDTYRKEIKKSKSYRDDIFVLDILREEMADDDPRIQRILFE